MVANEERPHFLIQLLRDLKKIKSDQLRCRALQSIQSVILDEEDSQRHDQDPDGIYADYREVLSRLWPSSPKSGGVSSMNVSD